MRLHAHSKSERMPRRVELARIPCDPPARFPRKGDMSSRLPLALAVALPLVLAACGGTETPASAPAASRSAKTATVAIKSFKYKPATVHVAAGGRVTFVNDDKAAHTATFTQGPSKLDTDRLRLGGRATLTFPKAGRYAYVCAFHAFMKGEVVVDN
jgi:plastocyanin